MNEEKSLRFYPKARLIFVVGILLTLSQAVFWEPARHSLLNLLVVGSGMVMGFVVFYAFLKRVKAAKYFIYISTLLIVFACIALVQSSRLQQAVLLAHLVGYISILTLLHIYREEAREYFRSQGVSVWVKVGYGIVFVALAAVTVAAVAYQHHLRSQSQMIAGDLEKDLIMEGNAPETAVLACKEKYAGNVGDLSEEELHRFCTCVALNLQAMMDSMQKPESSDMTDLLSKYMAIGDACMARIRQ